MQHLERERDAGGEDLVNTFFFSQEYAIRARSNRQFVADAYDTVLRRGPDSGGLNFWTSTLDNGSRTRDTLLNEFFASPEWINRANQVAAASCVLQ